MKDSNPAFKKAPAPRKAWSYKQLTEATEARIRSHADFLKELLALNPDDRLNHISVSQVSSWAYGAFNLWRDLTQGWHTPADEMRIRALADSVKHAGNENTAEEECAE
ncbi:hypothetical protein [Achromobacter xylosoxidans]|uniref:hypothetical protein n=1 Tax=Alcaligenes xylosoxydans xylosoxydans TaxID=85698 RepID=UPI003D292C7E